MKHDRLIDKLILYGMNWRIPETLEMTYQAALPFAEVLAQTHVNLKKTAVAQLSAPGTHLIYLDTPAGQMCCCVKVHLAVNPYAPLLIYHHGLGEYPFDGSWRRMFQVPLPVAMHRVLIQAPYHTSWTTPLTEGFQSLQHIYQMLAGSLSMMSLVQDYFEAQGVPYTALAGVSWGGITAMLYEGLFQRTRAVIPMLSSPHIAQTMRDIADLVGRPLTISQSDMDARLDFTSTVAGIGRHLYPLLGVDDLFFRWEHHAPLFQERPLVTVPGGHITNLWQIKALRHHLHQTLEKVEHGR